MEQRSYRDDLTITDDADLWRRVPPWHFVRDDNRGATRPSSAAFDDDGDGDPMSVLIAAESSGADRALAGLEGFALAAITAGLARECNQGVFRDPTPEEPAHAKVFAFVGRKTKSAMRCLARASTWVIEPPKR